MPVDARPRHLRALILWGVAAALGIAAGVNYARIEGNERDRIAKQAQSLGFSDMEDFQRISTLIETKPLLTLAPGDLELLETYAERPPPASSMVAGVLVNIGKEEIAYDCLDLARKLRARFPTNPIVLGLAIDWKSNGCVRASQKLSQEGWPDREGLKTVFN
jgi:hypothetical protein